MFAPFHCLQCLSISACQAPKEISSTLSKHLFYVYPRSLSFQTRALAPFQRRHLDWYLALKIAEKTVEKTKDTVPRALFRLLNAPGSAWNFSRRSLEWSELNSKFSLKMVFTIKFCRRRLIEY